MFPAIDLGIVEIPLYSSIFILAFFVAVLAARRTGPSYGITKEDILYGAVYAAIGIFVGAKLLYFITKLPALISGWDTVLKGLQENTIRTLLYVGNFALGGLVFYGGLIGGLFGIYRYCRHFKVPFVPFLDVFAPLIPFLHGMGRIGCFLSGCCYGIEYHGPGSVRFPHNDLVPGLDAVPRFPVQLLESFLNFVLCGILIYVSRKKNMKNGRTMGIYLIYYAIARFGLEMLRGDKIRGGISIFSTSQIISVILLPLGIVLVRGKWLEKRCKDSENVV